MTDELKSAWELALEKLDADESTAVGKLTKDQKEEIAEIRRKYKAKIAETEISLQSSIKKAAAKSDLDEIQTLRERLLAEKKRLNLEMESLISKVHSQ